MGQGEREWQARVLVDQPMGMKVKGAETGVGEIFGRWHRKRQNTTGVRASKKKESERTR